MKEFMNPANDLFVSLLPVEIVIPSLRGEEKIHAEGAFSRSFSFLETVFP